MGTQRTKIHKVKMGNNQQEQENQMDEKGKGPRVSRSKAATLHHHHEGSCSGSRGNGTTTSRRFTTTVDDGGGDLIECSGKYCRSCTAGLIADCVALCCCPCAVLHCFTLAFVKAPWVVGRRCLGFGKKKNNNNNKGHKRKCKRGHEDVVDVDKVVDNVVLERNKERGLKVGWPDHHSSSSSVSSGFGGVAAAAAPPMESVNLSAGFEAEKVWLELYQIGHLDFGRVSFSGD